MLPAVHAVSSDLIRRRARLGDWAASDWGFYALAVLESIAVWGALLLLASRRRGIARWVAACTLVALGALAMGGERYFYDQFDTYLNADAVLFAAAFPTSVHGQLAVHAGGLLSALVVPVVYFSVLAVVARKWIRPAYRSSRLATIAAPLLVTLVCLLPCSFRTVQAATPDVIWFHALGGLAKRFVRGSPPHVEPGIRRPPYLPALSSAAPVRRNVSHSDRERAVRCGVQRSRRRVRGYAVHASSGSRQSALLADAVEQLDDCNLVRCPPFGPQATETRDAVLPRRFSSTMRTRLDSILLIGRAST